MNDTIEEKAQQYRDKINLTLRKFVAPEFIFGLGARELAGRYAQHFEARKALIVSDPGVIAAGWTADVIENIELVGIPYVMFTSITPNPRAEEVMTGADLYQREGCNVLVAVGGGSVLDCAKGIGIVSSNRQHILTFEGVDQVHAPMPPLICIPTTAGSSADVSQFAIITNTQARVKIAIISKAVVPDIALIDPVVTTTMDPMLTACTGIDALVHAIEAFVSSGSSPMTDIHAIEAIRLICRNLPDVVHQPQNINARGQLMLGSLEAGLAFSNASLGGVHAMAHSLGGYKDLPHGECNAMLLRHVMNFNFEAIPERYVRIGEAMGMDLRGMTLKQKKHAISNEVSRLEHEIGICETLGQKGIRRADIRPLAANAIKDPCIATNPRKPNPRDIEVIYEEAL